VRDCDHMVDRAFSLQLLLCSTILIIPGHLGRCVMDITVSIAAVDARLLYGAPGHCMCILAANDKTPLRGTLQ
jgi:hypothetical protein